MTRSARITLVALFSAFALLACGGWTWLLAALGWPWPLVLFTLVVLCVTAAVAVVGTVGFYGMRAKAPADDPTEPDEASDLVQGLRRLSNDGGIDDRERWQS